MHKKVLKNSTEKTDLSKSDFMLTVNDAQFATV